MMLTLRLSLGSLRDTTEVSTNQSLDCRFYPTCNQRGLSLNNIALFKGDFRLVIGIFFLSLVGWMMFSIRVHMQSEKFRPLGIESRFEGCWCVFFGKERLQGMIAEHGTNQAGIRVKRRSGNERQSSISHHANRGKVTEHHIRAIKNY